MDPMNHITQNTFFHMVFPSINAPILYGSEAAAGFIPFLINCKNFGEMERAG